MRTRVTRLKTHNAVGIHGGKAENTTSLRIRVIRLKTHKAVGIHGGKAQKRSMSVYDTT